MNNNQTPIADDDSHFGTREEMIARYRDLQEKLTAAQALAEQRQAELQRAMSMIDVLMTRMSRAVHDAEALAERRQAEIDRTSSMPGEDKVEESSKVPPRLPNNDEVICPSCAREFRAIPVSAQRKINLLEDGSIAELAGQNRNVKEYMDHWESRAVKAEQELARLLKHSSRSRS